ncbi:hypothetical protein JCM19236_2088 [Vibrio sp. JCM 19236]|nr:hypothetical protein JCM19236_2088 [Vibrio sp. JCM 19236]
MQELSGGRKGSIFKTGDAVKRPLNPWSSSVHKLLKAFEQQQIDGVPRVLGTDQNAEYLSFVEGDTYNYPLVGNVASIQAIESAAKLLRTIHDASEPLVDELKSCNWMLQTREPAEVICHGDFTPYNVALQGNIVVGVFDFDTAHPAPRIWIWLTPSIAGHPLKLIQATGWEI